MKNERNNQSKSWPISFLMAGVVIGVILTMSLPKWWMSLDDEHVDSGPPATEAMAAEPVAETATPANESDTETSAVEIESERTIRITSEAEAREYLVGQWCAEGDNTVRITVDEDLTMQFETLDASFDPPWWIDQGSTQGSLRETGSEDNPDSRAFSIIGRLTHRTGSTVLLVTVLADRPVDKGTAIGIQRTQSELIGEYNEIYDLEDDCGSYPEGGPPPWER